MKDNIYKFIVETPDKRADVLLVEYFEEVGDAFSRNAIQELIKKDFVRVDGKAIKSSRILKQGESVEIKIPEQPKIEIKPENIPIRIVYEDEYLIVINKTPGLVVHPAPGNLQGTLVNAVSYHCEGKLSSIGGETRAGVVHRLDKDTSGLIVLAKENGTHLDLAKQFSNKTAGRIYYAVVWGFPGQEGSNRVETLFARHPADRKKFTSKVTSGKKAVTNYKVVSYNDDISLLRVQLETGRTHQIRVHMHDLGFPLLGDDVYGKRKERATAIKRQALHASSLTFIHPVYKLRLSFISPLESDIKELLEKEGLI